MADSFDAVFHGNSESECIDFACAVRQYARDNGRTKDNTWIADQLYSAFRGKAYKWYARLPVNVRGDWELLEQALLARWTTDDAGDDISASVSSPAILPTAARAPPSNLGPFGTAPQHPWAGKIGRVRIRPWSIVGAGYVSKGVAKSNYWSGAFNVTTDAALALKVQLTTAAPNFYRLELVEHETGLSALAAFSYNFDDWNDNRCWGFFVGVDALGQGYLKDRRTTFNGNNGQKSHQFWTDMWQIDNTGVLKLYGLGHITEAARFTVGYDTRKKDTLWFNGPKKLVFDGYEVEVDLQFEPLEG